MRCAPSLAASAAMLFIRLVLVATLLSGAMSWSAAASAGPGQHAAIGGLVHDIVFPRESALQMERKVKNDLPDLLAQDQLTSAVGPNQMECVLADADDGEVFDVLPVFFTHAAASPGGPVDPSSG